MRPVLFFIGLLLMTLSKCLSQSIIYGFPPTEKTLKKNDIILLNLPPHQDGRFRDSHQLLEIVDIINKYPDLKFKIEINVILETEDFNQAYSKSLARSLIKYLDKRIGEKNYEAVGLGGSNPIFLDERSPIYQKMNTRLQILLD